MTTATFGTNAVDWEQRVDFDRLHAQCLARRKPERDHSDLGTEDPLVAGQRYFSVAGSLPGLRHSQSHRSTAAGRREPLV
ncbi:hypothetical protein [Mycolicibacterium tokaiense]|uniref:Uncharacterized protein n=1 Tax=Mycolicibacterium tokaiense TaxID=39695 RepID=A0A378TGE8_9MYCO|nr:hypothetical protein [Mycolicibacterium tokaiense]STZ58883.1 Uncharacterised protein [Mycolicibacterium tokaiense]